MSDYKTKALAEAQAQGFAIATDLPSNHPYWCCHHEVEWEMVGDPYKRIHYILTKKPAHERQRRLHEFRPFSPSSMIALAEYERINGPALAEYQRIKGTARAEYERINGPALAEYQRIKGTALAEYERINGTALAEYERINGPAGAEYERIERTARAELCRHHIIDVPDTCWDGRTIFP